MPRPPRGRLLLRTVGLPSPAAHVRSRPAGIMSLHYARTAEGLLVATSIDVLLLHPAVSDRLDETSLADFLIMGRYRDFGVTAFEGIRRLLPAHAMTWSDGQVRLWRYCGFSPGSLSSASANRRPTALTSARFLTQLWPIGSLRTAWRSN